MAEIGRDYGADLLRKYENWAVYLHESQTYLGRTYIALARGGEIDPFTDTTTEEHTELHFVVAGLKTALTTLYQPDLLNYANLRNTWRHCHWHVVPRYAATRVVLGHRFSDLNWGKNYTPYQDAEIPSEVYEKIKSDLTLELSTN